MKLKERKDEALRKVEIAMDRLKRAGRKNEKAADLHLRKQQLQEQPTLDLTDSGLHAI